MPTPHAAVRKPKPRSPAFSVDFTNSTSTGSTEAKNTIASASVASRPPSAGTACRCPHAAERRLRTEVPPTSVLACTCKLISSTPHTKNDAASISSAVGLPAAATITPDTAGPSVTEAVKATFKAAFASRCAISSALSPRGLIPPVRLYDCRHEGVCRHEGILAGG